ncbi:MAG: lipoyl synthase [Pseudomonadota bacterium]
MPQTIIPVFDHSAHPNIGRMPHWIRQHLGDHTHYAGTAQAVREHALHTVCEEARCPNRGECWSRGTATFMLLGDTCTRACGFCAVKTGRPGGYDLGEPRRVADAVIGMGLDYVVLTSVNRDDLADGGAGVFAETIRELHRRRPSIGVELLTPDFQQCQEQAVKIIAGALDEPTSLVWGHNVETVPRLYRTVRRGSRYERSLRLLEQAGSQPGVETKSALMLGLGEKRAEVLDTLRDLRTTGVNRMTLGQYLRPTRYHLPVREYIAPEIFAEYESEARALGFAWVKTGPLVRSSYHAEENQ